MKPERVADVRIEANSSTGCGVDLGISRKARRLRQEVVDGIHRALRPAGALILFEKVLAPTARTQEVAVGAYLDWKRKQGFSDEEIAAKTRSIRGVLQPLTPEENEAMLRHAGFGETMQIFRWVLFEGLVAYA